MPPEQTVKVIFYVVVLCTKIVENGKSPMGDRRQLDPSRWQRNGWPSFVGEGVFRSKIYGHAFPTALES